MYVSEPAVLSPRQYVVVVASIMAQELGIVFTKYSFKQDFATEIANMQTLVR